MPATWWATPPEGQWRDQRLRGLSERRAAAACEGAFSAKKGMRVSDASGDKISRV